MIDTPRTKAEAMPNLHTLACELAKMDDTAGHNNDVIGAQATLASLRRKLNASTAEEAVGILDALVRGHPAIEFRFEMNNQALPPTAGGDTNP